MDQTVEGSGPFVNSKSGQNAPHLRHRKPKQSYPMMHII